MLFNINVFKKLKFQLCNGTERYKLQPFDVIYVKHANYSLFFILLLQNLFPK